MNYPQHLDELVAAARDMGASRAEVVPTGILEIKTGAWAKCFIPACKFYGSSIMCPPHNPLKPHITRRIVGEYDWALLFQLMAPVEDFVGPEWRTRHVPTELKHKEMVAELEGRAFAMGYPLAMGFAAGECSLCVPRQECSVLAGGECRHPLRARPAMEACGFDVFALMQKMGWPMVPIGDRCKPVEVPCASLVGLILLT